MWFLGRSASYGYFPLPALSISRNNKTVCPYKRAFRNLPANRGQGALCLLKYLFTTPTRAIRSLLAELLPMSQKTWTPLYHISTEVLDYLAIYTENEAHVENIRETSYPFILQRNCLDFGTGMSICHCTSSYRHAKNRILIQYKDNDSYFSFSIIQRD